MPRLAELLLHKVFKRLYVLNLWMEVGYTCPFVRYWSEVLCFTIPTHMNDLEVNIRDFENIYA